MPKPGRAPARLRIRARPGSPVGLVGAFLTPVLVLAGCGDDGPVLPRVALLQVEPNDTLVAPLDTVRLLATPLGLDGAPVAVPLTWQVEDATVGSVDSLGSFVARGEGETMVTAGEPGGVIGRSRVRVAPVSGLAPAHSAFGGTVTARRPARRTSPT